MNVLKTNQDNEQTTLQFTFNVVIYCSNELKSIALNLTFFLGSIS